MDIKKRRNLFAPRLTVDIPNGVLDPMAVRTGAYVVVQYFGMKETDTIRVTWSGNPSTPETLPGAPNGIVVAVILPSTIAAYLNKAVTVQYVVTFKDGSELSSTPLLFTMGSLSEEDLPPLDLHQMYDNVLDLRDVGNEVFVGTIAWPFIARGQPIWLKLKGASRDGDPLEVPLWEGRPTTNVSGFVDVFPRGEFERFANNSELSVIGKVAFEETAEESEAVNFPEKTFTLVTGPLVEVHENFDGQPDQLIVAGQRIDLETMSIQLDDPGGSSRSGIETIDDEPGFRVGPALVANKDGGYQSVLRLTFKEDFNRIKFTLTQDHNGSNDIIGFWDDAGLEVGFVTWGDLKENVDIYMLRPYQIRSMTVETDAPTYLDFFTLFKKG